VFNASFTLKFDEKSIIADSYNMNSDNLI